MTANVVKLNGKLFGRMRIDVKRMTWLVPKCSLCDAPCCQGVATGKGRCARLFGSKCTDYDNRPFGCALYPFWIDDTSRLTLDPSALWSTCWPSNPDKADVPAYVAHGESLTRCFGANVVRFIEILNEDQEKMIALERNSIDPVVFVPWTKYQQAMQASGRGCELSVQVGVPNI